MSLGFSKTAKQGEAVRLLSSDARHCMLYGGSRSGKTFINCYAIVVRACREKSRHAILRYKFNHLKTSIWMDTLPKVMSLAFPGLITADSWNKTDYCLTLPNGSEIWHAGLDDSARVEKILGKEYSTIYFNECSQIPYSSVNVALTRLAEKNDLVKKVYYDENPPSKRHWSYALFIRGVNPESGEPIDRDKYASILMNPQDNIENIDDQYLEILKSLPERDRDRFLSGNFADANEGNAYHSFEASMNVQPFDPRYKLGTVMVGLDFNVHPMSAVVGYFQGNAFHVMDEVYLENSDTPRMCAELIKRGYKGATIYPDSTGRNRKTSGMSDFFILEEQGFTIATTRNPFVKDRVNNVNRLLSNGRLIIDPKCKKLINDIEKVTWDGTQLDKKTDLMLTHISDALGYWCWAIDPYLPPQKSARQVQL